jgi:hypothetical protein
MTIGWWGIPLLFTIVIFGWVEIRGRISDKPQGHLPDFKALFEWLLAIPVVLVIWIVYLLFVIFI